jgi:hypothetical protein
MAEGELDMVGKRNTEPLQQTTGQPQHNSAYFQKWTA